MVHIMACSLEYWLLEKPTGNSSDINRYTKIHKNHINISKRQTNQTSDTKDKQISTNRSKR